MTTLYERLTDRNLLLSSWKAVRDKKAAGGVDGVSVQAFEERIEKNLDGIRDDLIEGRFEPMPYKQVMIPKGDGDFRALGLMTVRDKIAQHAVREVLEPILEQMFLDVSYGYRKEKGAARAIGRVQHLLVNEKRDWLVSCDIDKYFDTINHDRLFSMLSARIVDTKFLDLINVWIRMGKVDSGNRWKDTHLGIPQGGIISPLLSNFYLNPLDHFIVSRKYGYVRYADDFVILCRSKEEGVAALAAVSAFIRDRLKLNLNPEAGVRHIDEGFVFLGVTFKGKERSVSGEKLERIRGKILDAVRRDGFRVTKEVDELTRGLLAYYSKVLPQADLERFDEALADAYKTVAREVLTRGVRLGKRHLADFLKKIPFASLSWQTRRNKEIREIVDFAFRGRTPEPEPSTSEAASGAEEKPPAGSVDASSVVTPMASTPSAPPVSPKPPTDPVRKRKRQFQKLESAGFELVVSRPGSFVGKNQKGIVVKVGGQVVHSAPLPNLKHIMITSQGVSLSSNVVQYAVRNRIAIDYIEGAGLPYARVTSFHGTDVKLQLAQIEALRDGRASILAKTFVVGKIRNQRSLVKYYNKYRKTTDDEGFIREYGTKLTRMEEIEKEIGVLDKALDHDTLRGKLFSIEGRSASAYWDMIKVLLDEVVCFEGRVGQGATDLVNSLLNYGYGILYTKVWQAVARNGLNPYVSFLHVPQAGKPTLLFDLIEEFRPQAVDRAVFSMINKRVELKMDGTQLSHETRNKVATAVLERLNTSERFRGRDLRLFEVLGEQVRAVADFLRGDSPKYAPYLAKW